MAALPVGQHLMHKYIHSCFKFITIQPSILFNMNSPTSHPRPWIYLNGSPGAGKLTIANELQKLIPNSRVIHNHLVIELCINVFERSSPEYESLRTAVRQQVLNAISTTGRDTTYIFTGSHAMETEIGPLIARQHSNQATLQNIPFISILVRCDEEENIRRLTSASRTYKLRDVQLLKDIRKRTLFAFQCEYEMNADVTCLDPVEAAEMINTFVKDCMVKEKLKLEEVSA